MFGASKQTRSRARARPLTRYARPLSARHHVPWRAGAQVRHRARLLRRRQGVRARVRMRVRVLVPPHPFQSALATVAAHHLKRLASYWEEVGEGGEEVGGASSVDGVRSQPWTRSVHETQATQAGRVLASACKVACASKQTPFGRMCKAHSCWLTVPKKNEWIPRMDPIRGLALPRFPPPPLPVGNEPLQMTRSDCGERRMEGRERHTHARTQCRRRRRRAPGPTVMTRGEETCAHGEGTCACARAGPELLFCFI